MGEYWQFSLEWLVMALLVHKASLCTLEKSTLSSGYRVVQSKGRYTLRELSSKLPPRQAFCRVSALQVGRQKTILGQRVLSSGWNEGRNIKKQNRNVRKYIKEIYSKPEDAYKNAHTESLMLKNNIFHKQDYLIRVDMNTDLIGKEGSHLMGKRGSMGKILKEHGTPTTR